MEKLEYQKLVKEKSKNPYTLKNACISFISGGILGAGYEITTNIYINLFNLESTTAMSYSSLTFIILAVILTGLGVYDTLVSKYKFGLIVPITGFAHSVACALIDFRKEGLITGMGANAFKLAGSVLLYGIVGAFFMALLKVIIYG